MLRCRVTALERRRYVRIAPKGSIRASTGGELHVGRIAEHGTHDELLAAGGRYAAMFTAQAAGYR